MDQPKIECFVGHVFSKEQMDDLRRAIREGFAQYRDLSPWFADDHYTSGHILGKIQEGIDKCLFCIFELSERSRANVFLELGYALGKGKTCLLLVKKGNELPSDLAGLDRVEYESMIQLRQEIEKYLPQVIGEALNKCRPVGEVDTRVMSWISPSIASGDLIDVSALTQKAGSEGIPEIKVQQTLKGLENAGYVRHERGTWIVSGTGGYCIPQIVKQAREILR